MNLELPQDTKVLSTQGWVKLNETENVKAITYNEDKNYDLYISTPNSNRFAINEEHITASDVERTMKEFLPTIELINKVELGVPEHFKSGIPSAYAWRFLQNYLETPGGVSIYKV